IEPFTEDYAEQMIAALVDLPFESFSLEDPFLKAYIPQESFSAQRVKSLLSGFEGQGKTKIKYSCNLIPERNWNALWESNYTPVIVDKRCKVRASFHKGLPRTKYTVQIDPKMAFGTGHHQTTRLMIEALLDCKVKNKKVIDVGCGTGVLAILAAKMGAALPVHALDIDPVAVDSAIENSLRNRVGHKIRCVRGDASVIQFSSYDLLLANINRNIILEDISVYSRAALGGGRVILSGFLVQDESAILKAAEQAGLEFLHSASLEGWSVMLFQKGSEVR
ncbi:MAG: 50S ribosomal protein L11 methyltransferase, partial [Bacteroidales bacterium]|nr:50S ribosomal protein L11 methyltransferase [Bacteroidales bacterium]